MSNVLSRSAHSKEFSTSSASLLESLSTISSPLNQRLARLGLDDLVAFGAPESVVLEAFFLGSVLACPEVLNDLCQISAADDLAVDFQADHASLVAAIRSDC